MKKFLLIVLCLILACPAALAGTTARDLLIRDQGGQPIRYLIQNELWEYDYEYAGNTYSPITSSTEMPSEQNDESKYIRYIVADDGSVIVTWIWIDGITDLPETITDEKGSVLSVTGLGETAVVGNAETMTIPRNILTIDGNPFMHLGGTNAYRVVSDHETLATIDGVLFEKASRKLIAYPSGLGGTYTVPDGIIEIGPMAFCCVNNGTQPIENITFPGTLLIVGEYSFAANTVLASIELPEGLETIGEGAFFRCENLADINIPSTVTSIGAKAFDQTAVTTFTIPASVEYIGEAAFGSIDGKTLIVEKGSYAAEYAADNGYYYEYVDGDDTSWLDAASDEEEYNEEDAAEVIDETTEEPESYEEDDSWLE